jgi:hypothetical protein
LLGLPVAALEESSEAFNTSGGIADILPQASAEGRV